MRKTMHQLRELIRESLKLQQFERFSSVEMQLVHAIEKFSMNREKLKKQLRFQENGILNNSHEHPYVWIASYLDYELKFALKHGMSAEQSHKRFIDAIKNVNNQSYGLSGESITVLAQKILNEIDEQLKKPFHLKPAEVRPDEEKEARLGKYAFPTARGFPDIYQQIDPDTEFERQLEEKLITHVEFSAKFSIDEINFLQTALKRGWYKEVFKRPQETYLYRGLNITKNDVFEQLVGDQFDNIPSHGHKKVSLMIKTGLADLHSWTTDKQVANDFSQRSQFQHAIVLTCKTNENMNKFLEGSSLGMFDKGPETENEVIALSSQIKICEIEWKKRRNNEIIVP